MSWLSKIFGKKPIEETYSPPSTEKAKDEGIWIVHWTAFHYKYDGWAEPINKFKVFKSQLEAELHKEQIEIANKLIGNIWTHEVRIEKQS